MIRAAAIVQARMGSSRMPGKVLESLAGFPLLWHVVHRLRKARTLSGIAVATSTARGDDRLAEYAHSLGVKVVRGPEDDVLARFALAAQALDSEILVRVTGDAPLVDPGIVDALVEELARSGADFATGAPGPCIHEGIDPFTRRALDRLLAEAREDPVAREHVTGYFKAHPGFARAAFLRIPPEHQFSGARISVDAPADLHFLETVYARLGAAPGEADIAQVVRLLREEPALLSINARVRQKPLAQRAAKALIRCDGDADIGLGHVYRCLALADELRERQGVGVAFAVQRGEAAVELVRRAGHALERAPQGAGEEAWLENLAAGAAPDLLVLDVRTSLSREAVERLRARVGLVASIDDASDRRLACDHVFAPPVPQVRELDWISFRGELHCGFEWILLRPQFARGRLAEPARETPQVFVAMGGSDPAGLTLKAVEALDALEGDFETRILVGPAFAHDRALAARLGAARRRFEVLRGAEDVATLMAQSDLAVASFGMTAYELAALGVPAVLLSLTEDHARSASALAGAGAAVSLNVHGRVSPGDLAAAAGALLRDPERRGAMSRAASSLIDGRGAERTAEVLARAIASRRVDCPPSPR